MYTAEQQVFIYQLAKYEKDPMKNGREIAERRWWERNKRKRKEKTTQQQKGLPTLSADLKKSCPQWNLRPLIFGSAAINANNCVYGGFSDSHFVKSDLYTYFLCTTPDPKIAGPDPILGKTFSFCNSRLLCVACCSTKPHTNEINPDIHPANILF